MPIKGVSNVIRLPRLGKIRLGIRREGGDGIFYPVPTDYFVCPDEVKKVFGEKPIQLTIMFPTDDPSQWASQFLRCYSPARELVCRGDGESAIARIDRKTGMLATRSTEEFDLREITCNPATCPHCQVKHCRRVMNLQFLLPTCPGFGVYQLDTSSFNSIVNVNSGLELVYSISRRYSLIPLSLSLGEQPVQVGGVRMTARVLSLTPPFSAVELQRYAQVPREEALLLPAPDAEAPDDLFPEEVLGSEKPEADLLELWARAKHLIWHHDIQDDQIGRWFQKNYDLKVCLADLEEARPPQKLGVEQLSHFCREVTSYTTGR